MHVAIQSVICVCGIGDEKGKGHWEGITVTLSFPSLPKDRLGPCMAYLSLVVFWQGVE